jgi:Metallo-beta-lactamase superfamily
MCPVDNNVWLLGDDYEVLVVDASHDLGPVREAIAGRRVFGIVCTHGHSDHVNQAGAASTEFGAPTMLHPDDVELWHQTYPDVLPDEELVQNQVLRLAHVVVRVLHTPGHTPGSVSLYVPASNRCSAATRCSPADPAEPGRRTAISPRSFARPKPSCCRCRCRRGSFPATETPRPSPRNRRTSPTGSPGVTEQGDPHHLRRVDHDELPCERRQHADSIPGFGHIGHGYSAWLRQMRYVGRNRRPEDP